MSDPTETTDQAAANLSSSTGPGAGTGAPAGYVELARLTGALQKVQELTLVNRTLTEQLGAATSQLGLTQGTVAQKETEKMAMSSEHVSAIQAIQTKLDKALADIAVNATEKMKIEALKAINHPELISILDSLPAGVDLEATKASLLRIAAYGDNLKNMREAQLLAGITTTAGQGGPLTPPEPTTDADWTKKIEATPFGSPERQAAWDGYFAFSQKQT